MILTRINALAELERAGIKFEPVGDEEVKIVCPAHEDTKPSATLNVKKNVWTCFTSDCRAKGDVVSLLALYLKVERNTILADLGTRYDLEKAKTISVETVERFHARIWEAGPLLQALRDRGVTDEAIRDARLGFQKGRITIPVYDESRQVRDILRYLPGASSGKMLHTTGYSKLRIYRPADLDKPKILLCGGPIKALVAAYHTPDDVGCISTTGGEGSWDPEWSQRLHGKQVWVCMDVDKAGEAAARVLARALYPYGERVYILDLPLDRGRFPKGDLNDYVAQGSPQLAEIMAACQAYEPPPMAAEIPVKGTRTTTLAQVSDPDSVGWRLEFEAVPSAIADPPYFVPDRCLVECRRNEPNCHECPISLIEPDERGFAETSIKPSSSAFLALVEEEITQPMMREALRIPKCGSVEIKPETYHRVTDIRLSPQLELSNQGSGNLVQPALVIGEEPSLNVNYQFSGRVYPHPKSQRVSLVLDEMHEAADSLAKFTQTDEEWEELERAFRPVEWNVDSVQEKLRSIYMDLSANVTKIHGRPDLHLAYDLAYHSPLYCEMNGRKVNGWAQVLVAGDSAQGKSETFIRLQQHYGLGERVECKNASVAGLVGGLKQIGNRWFSSWGFIPTNDGRLVALEEIKGASVEVLSKLTDMRSSGIAEIPKIERRRAFARTRLLCISNPRHGRDVSSYSFGVEMLVELIGSLEDLRRFDFALVVAAGQVPIDVVNAEHATPHVYTADLCHRLVLCAWTCKDVRLEAEDEIRQASARLCSKYDERIPLVDRGTIGQKLLRLAAGLAGRTCSYEDGALVVRSCHVQIVEELLDRAYSDKSMAYDKYSEAQRAMDDILKPTMVESLLRNTNHPRALVEGLLYRDLITQQDIQDYVEADRDTGALILSMLVRHRCLKRLKRSSYVKSGPFIALLRHMQTQSLEKDADDYTEF